MQTVDRTQLLRLLDLRHDDLMRQLDDLNERIESALVKTGDLEKAASTPRAAPSGSVTPTVG
jgi:hypothetical protein